MKTLVLIPARGGSKGVPHKNIKMLNGKPLIQYSIEVARQIVTDEDICVSTDDEEIKTVVEKLGLNVPFLRPAEYASDTASSNDVIVHALNFYKDKGVNYDVVILLQPTSPFRTSKHVKEAMSIYSPSIDMVVSVRPSISAYVICEENQDGFLLPVIKKNVTRRQDMDSYYEYNGAVYVINVESLRKTGLSNFSKKKKYVMDELSSWDIDTMTDWKICELLLKGNCVEI